MAPRKQFSIAAARNNLPSIVHAVERGSAIELTRRGQPVAVLLSMHEYERLEATRVRFSDAYRAFRATADLESLDLEPEFFAALRDRTSGRGVDL